jgi:speckle-type POZ protein
LCKYIDVDTVVNILALAELHHCHGLKNACVSFLSSPGNLKTAMDSDGFEHLSTTCPSVMKELITMCSAP